MESKPFSPIPTRSDIFVAIAEAVRLGGGAFSEDQLRAANDKGEITARRDGRNNRLFSVQSLQLWFQAQYVKQKKEEAKERARHVKREASRHARKD